MPAITAVLAVTARVASRKSATGPVRFRGQAHTSKRDSATEARRAKGELRRLIERIR